MKKCVYCSECIYYEKCSVNAPNRMNCKAGRLGCGAPVCCEDFISRKSIFEIYEEQKRSGETFCTQVEEILLYDYDEDVELPF